VVQAAATSDSAPPGGAGATGTGPPRLGHLPGLDGIRGVAVLSVLLFHGGVSWAPGGFLGVDVFFVLSGFLITSLLIDEWGRTGAIGLGGFWVRRARRLLPGLLVLVGGAAVYAWLIASPEALAGIRHDVFATLAYFANWHFIASQASYFARTGDPSPLAHTWSLAIEEQFYVVWPLLVLAVLRGRRPLGRLALLAAAGLVASATAMAVVYRPDADPSRVYYGTDTRSHVIMAGALLAVGLAAWRRRGAGREEGPARPDGRIGAWLRRRSRPAVFDQDAVDAPVGVASAGGASGRVGRRVLGAAAVPAAAAVLGAMGVAQGTDAWVYRGGLVAVAAGVVVVIAAVAIAPASPVPWLLSRSPLRFVGRISYGMYLYHWPLFLVLDHARTGLLGFRLLAVRLAATTAVSIVSYYLLEQPIRRGALRRWRAAAALPFGVAAVAAGTLAATTLPVLSAAAVPVAARTHAPLPARASATVRIVRPPIPAGAPVKVMVVGDSVAETLAAGLSAPARQMGIDLLNEGTLGCGVVRGGPYEYFGATHPDLPECATWPQRWAGLVRAHDPDVVFMVVGRWEVMDRVHNGAWTRVGDPAFDAYLESELNTAVDVLTARGATLALATAPYYLRGERPDGGRWPEDDPARVDAFNRLIRDVAAHHPQSVAVIDLGGHTSVGGRYTPYIDGIEMRYDGVHFTPQADQWLAPWLLPQLLALAPPTVGGRVIPPVPAQNETPAYSTPTSAYRRTYTYRTTTTLSRSLSTGSSSPTVARSSSTTAPVATSTTRSQQTTTTRPGTTTTTRPATTTTTRP
jgi:peptidoglycan/LPS O-acetylase OafA/YrhL